MHADDLANRRCVEWQASGEREVPDDAERVEIARRVNGLAGDLLWTRVVWTSRDRAVAGSRVGVRRARDAEVGHHRASRRALDEDVVGLHVAMDEAARVGVGQRPRSLAEDACRLMWRERSAVGDPLGERFAGNVRHDEVDEALRFVDPMDRDDVGMGEARGHLRFANELLASFGQHRQLRRQHFDRDLARQPDLARQIHDAHAAAAELPLEGILAGEGGLKLDKKGVGAGWSFWRFEWRRAHGLSYEPITRFTTHGVPVLRPQRSFHVLPQGLRPQSRCPGRPCGRLRRPDRRPAASNAYTLTAGDTTVRLAREFGFCYGVERAVEYAYQTRRKFPDRRIFLVGEIIHNPHVNDRLREMGIEILERPEPTGAFDFSAIAPEDVVILPAFGVTIDDFAALREIGCVLVDTTCGSVLNVWKRVESYARDGFTALIHGKYYHEETRATASQVRKYPDGHYLDRAQHGRSATRLRLHRGTRLSARGADVDVSRARCRLDSTPSATCSASAWRTRRRCWRANRSPSPRRSATRSRARAARRRAPASFRSFDTICSATQERQDAVRELLDEGARRDGRDRRLQLEQHDLARGALRRARADVPHRDVDGDRSGRGTHPLSPRAR